MFLRGFSRGSDVKKPFISNWDYSCKARNLQGTSCRYFNFWVRTSSAFRCRLTFSHKVCSIFSKPTARSCAPSKPSNSEINLHKKSLRAKALWAYKSANLSLVLSDNWAIWVSMDTTRNMQKLCSPWLSFNNRWKLSNLLRRRKSPFRDWWTACISEILFWKIATSIKWFRIQS